MKKYLLLATTAFMVMLGACTDPVPNPTPEPKPTPPEDTIMPAPDSIAKYIPEGYSYVELAYFCKAGVYNEINPVYSLYFKTKGTSSTVNFKDIGLSDGTLVEEIILDEKSGSCIWDIQLISRKNKNDLPSLTKYTAAYDPADPSYKSDATMQLSTRCFVMGYNSGAGMEGMTGGQEAPNGSIRMGHPKEGSANPYDYKYIRGGSITISQPDQESKDKNCYLYLMEFEYSDYTEQKLAYYGETPLSKGTGE